MISSRRVQILYIVDDVESKWQSIQKYWHLDNVTFLSSKQCDKVFKDSNVDAIFVATPTITHKDIVIKALQAKKAVFCEKPIAEDRPSTVKCYEMAKKVGKPLFTAFNRRFDPSYWNLKERVHKGEVGHVHMIKRVAHDSPLLSLEYLKVSGGIFHDCLVHDIDLIVWVSVLAHANIPEIKAIGDFDTVAVNFHFPSGTLGMIDLSRNSPYGYDQRLEVFGPKGMLQADNRQLNSVHLYNELQGITTAPIWYSWPSRFMNAYIREFDHFLDVVHGKIESEVKSKDILAVSKIATACEESARLGKVVELIWTKDELPDNL
ncbi:DHDH dehydrogenase, partial [Acromyrmex heyeri]